VIDKYKEFASLVCVFMTSRGFITIDLIMRRALIDSAIPFFPFSTTTLLHLFSALVLHRRPTEDTICKNCGGHHRTQECDLFALVFLSDPTTPAASRRGHERDHSTSRSRTRSRSASTARASAYRGRSTSRARSETSTTRKPAANVAFTPAATEKNACHQFKNSGSCSFGSSCKYKH